MNGTAADMQIVENLALAARRGEKRRVLRWGVPKADIGVLFLSRRLHPGH